jgi:hypothetical protein
MPGMSKQLTIGSSWQRRIPTQITPFQCLNLNVGPPQNLPIAQG